MSEALGKCYHDSAKELHQCPRCGDSTRRASYMPEQRQHPWLNPGAIKIGDAALKYGVSVRQIRGWYEKGLVRKLCSGYYDEPSLVAALQELNEAGTLPSAANATLVRDVSRSIINSAFTG